MRRLAVGLRSFFGVALPLATALQASCRKHEIQAQEKPVAALPVPEPPTPTLACAQTQRADRGETTGALWPPEAAAGVQARFLAFGDSGTGEPSQFLVAAAMKQHCLRHGCDFAVHTGDIFYPFGATSTSDARLRDRFEGPYAPLGMPIYLSLGNHDYYPPANPDAAVAYTRLSPSKAWRLPARWYTFLEHGVRFLAIDTNSPNAAQETWARGVLAESRRNGEPWIIAFGHHPRFSDGRHGDAETDVAEWLERVLCFRADVLISGHDHVLEVMKPQCGLHQIVTGAGGAALYDLAPTPRGLFEAKAFGFAALTARGATLSATFIDQTGAELCTTSWQKAGQALGCGADTVCNNDCSGDPDCTGTDCGKDGRCNLACSDDRDCEPAGACTCDRDPRACEPRESGSTARCGCDAGCWRGPAVDGASR